jgi:hypothetical protein
MAKNVVTVFKNIKNTDTPFHRSVALVFERIKNGASKALISQIRTTTDKAERSDLKKELPSICFSGEFTKRNDQSIVQHSGLVCLDFDGYANRKELIAAKEGFQKDEYTYSVFISPSGAGLKVLVKIPPQPEKHKDYFNGLRQYYNDEHFDTTSKNLSRVCYESYDPLIYINYDSLLFDKEAEQEYQEIDRTSGRVTIPITDENKIVDILVKWWEKKFPMAEGQRNNNAFVLAAAFNDFGVSKSLAEYVLGNYADKDFTAAEIKRTIQSAYAATEKFGSKYYEDEEKIENVKRRIRRGASHKEIKRYLEDDNVEPMAIEAVIAKAEADRSNSTFWVKNDKGTIKIIPVHFKEFLEDNGFYKYSPPGTTNFVFVRVTNNLIDHTSEQEIKDFVLEYLLDFDDISVYNYFAEATRYFREEFLSLLASINVFFIEDTKTEAYLYYRNCAVRITKDDVQTIDYIDLGGYVWKDQVIDRDFKKVDSGDCDFSQFISNICASNSERVKAMRSTIGFLLHGYKDLGFCPAVILNDEVISDNPEGGTGKGLFMNAIGRMKKMVTIDGKAFNFEHTFAYQLVSADTQVLCFDDVKKNFTFERLFSVITEGVTLEKKNKDAIRIPFDQSPKIAITTNYAIKGSGNSFERRKWELELHQYYRLNYTPEDEFGRLMFEGWDHGEWHRFDNYMLENLQMYLSNGLVQSEFVNLRVRKLSAETSHEFIEWCGLVDDSTNHLLEPDVKLYKQDLYFNFIEDNPDYGPKSKMTISRTRFYKWLNSYAIFKSGMPPEEGRDAQGRWLRIRQRDIAKVEEEEEQFPEFDF